MLDKLGVKLIRVLTNFCGDNGYSIIEIAELKTAFSNKLENEVLVKYIDHLVAHEYIDVKYIDDKQICLALLPKAKFHEEDNKENKKMKVKYIRISFFMTLASMIAGFVGAFLGAYFFNMMR